MMIKRDEIIAIGITLFIALVLGTISIRFLDEYGLALFFLTPLLIGFLPAYIISIKEEVSNRKIYRLGFLTLALANLGLLVFAMEGLICIVMALPINILTTFVGGAFAGALIKRRKLNMPNVLVLIVLSSIGFMSFDEISGEPTLRPVETYVVVDANIETVWKHVVTFDAIPEPTDWLFSTGIAYPTHATIEGEGVGAVRYCNFTTGTFVEPITIWDKPNVLAFDVESHPIPMNEFNPFWDIQPKHLNGYFKSYKGQFELSDLGNNTTGIKGTTWYTVDIKPAVYWYLWSDMIIHRIHKRVLNHIQAKASAEMDLLILE